MVWNASESMPRGLYWINHGPAPRGDSVAARLPDAIAEFAARRTYLSKSAVLIKQVAATGGDLVCRFGTNIFINAHFKVRAHIRDRAGRPMPQWTGCRVLAAHELFLAGHGPDSFDSRYFGPIDASRIIGRATLI